MGTRLIDSVPPATATSDRPLATASAARAMAWRPDEQKRLMVMAAAVTGTPASKLAMRATFMPCSASGIAQPRMTSSIISGRTAGCAPARLDGGGGRSSGRACRSALAGPPPASEHSKR
jgi:hypothetical protein